MALIELIPVPKTIKQYPFLYLFLTLMGSGRIKPAPGTWGTLASVPIGFLIAYYFSPLILLYVAIFFFFVGGVLATKYKKETGKEDASEVVIDEAVGMWIALLPAGFYWEYWLVAFLLFRLFDASKFGPVGFCDRSIKGGFGVMLDDLVAGVMTALIILLVRNELGELPNVVSTFLNGIS